MVISRALIVTAAAVGLLCASPPVDRLAPQADVLVVYDSRQPRRTPPLDCAKCEALDLATGLLPARRYEAIVLDGHSLPPENVIGVPLDRIAVLLERAAPRLLVSITCYGAELHLLEAFFASSARAETALASADALPWPGAGIDDTCLAHHGAAPACFKVPAAVRTFSREDLERLDEQVVEAWAAIAACRSPFPYARLRPLYLCVDDQAGPPAVLEVSFDELPHDCGTQSPDDLRVVHCGLRGGSSARDTAPPR